MLSRNFYSDFKLFYLLFFPKGCVRNWIFGFLQVWHYMPAPPQYVTAFMYIFHTFYISICKKLKIKDLKILLKLKWVLKLFFVVFD